MLLNILIPELSTFGISPQMDHFWVNLPGFLISTILGSNSRRIGIKTLFGGVQNGPFWAPMGLRPGGVLGGSLIRGAPGVPDPGSLVRGEAR
jgi:hypothetical protein